MTTQNVRYEPAEFPFYALFDELTGWIVERHSDPVQSYLYYRHLRSERNLTQCPDYASTSITSGGHAYVPGRKAAEIIAANTRTARDTVALMGSQGTVHAPHIIVPVDLGYVPHWRQSDYMEFWSLLISGLDVDEARQAHYRAVRDYWLEQEQVDSPRMNDSRLSPEVRAAEYFKFARAFFRTDRALARDPNRIRNLINLVDPSRSLGCQTERMLAKLLGIPVKRIIAVAPAKAADLSVTSYKLRTDIDLIIRYGGTVIDLNDRHILTLGR